MGILGNLVIRGRGLALVAAGWWPGPALAAALVAGAALAAALVAALAPVVAVALAPVAAAALVAVAALAAAVWGWFLFLA